MNLNYKKKYIGLARNGVVNNLTALFPATTPSLSSASTRTTASRPRSKTPESTVFDYNQRKRRYKIRLRQADLVDHRDVLLDLVRRASNTPSPGED